MGESEKPRSEPEIMPDEAGHEAQGKPRVRVFVDRRGTERVYIVKPSPLGAILITLITAILSAVLLVLLLGAFLFVAPFVVLFVAAVIIVGLLRVFFSAN